MSDDILGYLRANPFDCFVLSLTRKDRYHPRVRSIAFALQNRILAIHAYLRGYVTFSEFARFFLPSRYKSHELKAKFAAYVNAEISLAAKRHIRDFLRGDGSVTIYGRAFYPAFGNYGELLDLLAQVFVLDQYKAAGYLKDGFVVLDAGANIGSFSVFASNLRKGLVIHAFEPVKETYELLKMNTSAYENIHCHNMGLGDSAGRKKIYSGTDTTTGNSFEDRAGSAQGDRRVNVTIESATVSTIDQFVEDNKIERVDYIKIDTEGYEAKILKGAQKTIGKYHPIIAVSAYHDEGDRALLPKIIKGAHPGYGHEVVKSAEEDLIFFPVA